MNDSNNVEIDLYEDFAADSAEKSENSVQLPVNFIRFGQTAPGDVKVYIKQYAYKSIEKLAQSDTTRELGSILVGTAEESLGSYHVIITDVIEAKYTDASASTLTFTHETWEYVHQQMAEKYPDKKILGWQHTHPSYGIFLSNYDMFIQENFFNLPFQIAYVVDPVQHLRGFFQWKDQKVQKLEGFYVYDDVGKEIRLSAPKQPKDKAAKAAPAGKSHVGWLTALSVAVAALGILCAVLFGRIAKLNTEKQTPAISAEAGQTASEDPTVSSLEERLTSAEAEIARQADTISQLEQALAEEQSYLHLAPYTVQPGDSIYHICELNGLDFASGKDIIKGVNGLDSNYTIYSGQVLWIPVSQTPEE